MRRRIDQEAGAARRYTSLRARRRREPGLRRPPWSTSHRRARPAGREPLMLALGARTRRCARAGRTRSARCGSAPTVRAIDHAARVQPMRGARRPWITMTARVSGCATGIAVTGEGVRVERNWYRQTSPASGDPRVADTRILETCSRQNASPSPRERPTKIGAWAGSFRARGEVAATNLGQRAFSHDYGRDERRRDIRGPREPRAQQRACDKEAYRTRNATTETSSPTTS